MNSIRILLASSIVVTKSPLLKPRLFKILSLIFCLGMEKKNRVDVVEMNSRLGIVVRRTILGSNVNRVPFFGSFAVTSRSIASI
jgi:hypothetical protein